MTGKENLTILEQRMKILESIMHRTGKAAWRGGIQ
jgi:hypothetical protein